MCYNDAIIKKGNEIEMLRVLSVGIVVLVCFFITAGIAALFDLLEEWDRG